MKKYQQIIKLATNLKYTDCCDLTCSEELYNELINELDGKDFIKTPFCYLQIHKNSTLKPFHFILEYDNGEGTQEFVINNNEIKEII